MNVPVPGATIVCCAESSDPNWRWLEPNVKDMGVRFEFARCTPRNFLEKNVPVVNLARLRGSLEAVRKAKRLGADAIVTHGPTLAAWCSLFARIYRLKIPILGHTFNFTTLPATVKRRVFAAALTRVDRFVVFSAMERDLYAQAFRLPARLFDVVLWGVRHPAVNTPDIPFHAGDYVCAIGGNARDYATLVEAARRLPELDFVLVVRPDSLRGLTLPENVQVYENLPFGQAMNVLLHSRFMALPLIGSEVPCGHVTLVAAMHLGKAFIITESTGVEDYARDGENALTVAARSPESLVSAIRRLWDDRGLCERLAENGRQFVSRECTEERIAEHFRAWLRAKGLASAEHR